MKNFLEYKYRLEDVELIDRHLRGTLNADETTVLEARLKAEPELRNLQRSLTGLSLAARRNQLGEKKQMLNTLEAEMTRRVRPVYGKRKFMLRAAAVAAILVAGIVTAVFLINDDVPDVFTEMYDPLQDLNDGFRSIDTAAPLGDALRYVESGAYAKGARAYMRAFEQSGDTTHLFYAAISWIGAGKTTRAMQQLGVCEGHVNAEDFHYYYILNLVRQGALDEALTYLNTQYPEARPNRIQRLYKSLQK